MVVLKKRNYKEKDLFDSLQSLQNRAHGLTEVMIQQAKHGDKQACFEVAQAYKGLRVYTKALAWYQKAAYQNYSEAQTAIGFMHYKGLWLFENYALAMEWFLKAAHNDRNKNAQFFIGEIYQNGYGVTRNIHTAIEWYTQAALQNHVEAQYTLGEINEHEDQVRDLQKSVNYYQKAVDNGHDLANIGLSRLNRMRYYARCEDADKFEIFEEQINRLEELFRVKLNIIQEQNSKLEEELKKHRKNEKQLRKVPANDKLIMV